MRLFCGNMAKFLKKRNIREKVLTGVVAGLAILTLAGIDRFLDYEPREVVSEIKVAEIKDTSGNKIDGRFAIVDSTQLMFMLLDDKTVHPNYDVAVWLSTPFLAQSLEQMFNASWDNFAPLGKIKGK